MRQTQHWQRWTWTAISLAWIALTIWDPTTIRIVFACAYAALAIGWWVIWWRARRKSAP